MTANSQDEQYPREFYESHIAGNSREFRDGIPGGLGQWDQEIDVAQI